MVAWLTGEVIDGQWRGVDHIGKAHSCKCHQEEFVVFCVHDLIGISAKVLRTFFLVKTVKRAGGRIGARRNDEIKLFAETDSIDETMKNSDKSCLRVTHG